MRAEVEMDHPTGRIGPCQPLTVVRAQHERDRLQARRLRAAELFALGMRQAEVARQLGVSARRWPRLRLCNRVSTAAQ